MADKQIDSDIVKEFASLVVKDVQQRFGDNCSNETMIYHLIERGILQTSLVRNYLIIRNYHNYQTSQTGTLNNYCYVMEEKFNLSGRQIHNIIGKYFKRFFIEKHISS